MNQHAPNTNFTPGYAKPREYAEPPRTNDDDQPNPLDFDPKAIAKQLARLDALQEPTAPHAPLDLEHRRRSNAQQRRRLGLPPDPRNRDQFSARLR